MKYYKEKKERDPIYIFFVTCVALILGSLFALAIYTAITHPC